MVILEEQVYLGVDVSQIIHQSRYDCAWIDQEALLDQVNRGRAHPLARALQGVSQIEEEGRRLVIISIDGQPCDCIAALLKSLQPSHRQRGLAEPCRALDHGQTLFRKLRGGVHEPWTLDQPRTTRRNDLGGEELLLFPAKHRTLARGRPAHRAHCMRLYQRTSPSNRRSITPLGDRA